MIDPNNITTVRVGELPPADFNLTDNIPHEIGTELFKGTLQKLADTVGAYLGTSDSLAFNPTTITDGGTLPSTTSKEWMLVGKGTFHNVGGAPDIVTTEELNAVTSNGLYWSLAVQIPINVEFAGITQNIRSGYLDTTPSENAVFNALALKLNASDLQSLSSSDIANASTVSGDNVSNALDYLDSQITLNITPDATTTIKGKIKLAGDLGGNADLPTVPALVNFSLKQNFINIKDLGGIGNGVFDNTTIVNNALATYKEVYLPDGNYLVTSLLNDFGSKITGPGIIVKAITGGTQQLNTGIDRFNYVFGQEYLSFVQNKFLSLGSFGTVPTKISWSGDSTTAGDAITDSGFILSNLFLFTVRRNSISSVTSLNRGHSGANTEQWRTTYLTADLAENPDLYIIRWGINDASRGLSAFRTSLRTGLATIRASKTQAQMSIILMSPNSTSDTPNGRDEKWYEQVRLIYIQAARDYKCAFIDTYALWLDSRGAADIYMDNPYADGRAIHPFNVFNSWIVSKVFYLVFPASLKAKSSSGYLVNESSADKMPLVADLPTTYQKGLTISRAYVAPASPAFPANWNVDGTLATYFNTDGAGYQLNVSKNTTIPDIFFRSFMGDIPAPLTWSSTVKLWHSGNLSNPVSGSGTNNFLSKYTGASALGSSLIFDNGTSVGVGTISPLGKFHVKVATNQNLFISDMSGKTGITTVNDAVSLNTSFGINASSIDLMIGGANKLSVLSGGGINIASLAGTGSSQVYADASGNLSRGSGYISYVAILSQSATAAPTVINTMANGLSGSIVWSYTSVGTYTGTLSGAFTVGKTVLFLSANTASLNPAGFIGGAAASVNTVQVNTKNQSGVLADSILAGTAIEIRVYI